VPRYTLNQFVRISPAAVSRRESIFQRTEPMLTTHIDARKTFFHTTILLGLAGGSICACAQGPATVTPQPRQGSWMKQHEEFLKTAQAGNVDLLFLGDSITQGWRGARKTWDRFYGPRKAANFGIGGDRTEHVLWRIENGELNGIEPKVVVLMIGTNNADGSTPDEIAQGVTAIVHEIHSRLPKTKILLLAVFPRGEKPGPMRERLKSVNEKIAKLDDGSTVHYLDIGKVFLSEDGTISNKIMPDYLHLSGRGYRLWAEAMEPTLWSMLDEPKHGAENK
jgi:lysophospholipase L1-like esterase